MKPVAASFRDPGGFVFTHEGALYRQINDCYRDDYEHLRRSGLYATLVGQGMLVAHEELSDFPVLGPAGYKIIQPTAIPFTSYPYEWCFGQLKDAALLTLQMQREAFAQKMVLKDASAFNVQFVGGKPVFIDTLSFEKYRDGEPWAAYEQVCRHFVAPLALMARVDGRLGQLSQQHLAGIPLDLVSKLLPWTTKLSLRYLMHLHWHAKAQAHFANGGTAPKKKISNLGFRGLVDSLESFVRGLNWKVPQTEWRDYYAATNYSPESLAHKETLLRQFVESVPAVEYVMDWGGNTGRFSELISARSKVVINADCDPAAVESSYQRSKTLKQENVLSLLVDLANPSPGVGWDNEERPSFLKRRPMDLTIVLALVHHLAITHQIPLPKLAATLAELTSWLLIEFVPREDSQVAQMLASRTSPFPGYHAEGFENAFSAHFDAVKTEKIKGTARTLHLFKRR